MTVQSNNKEVEREQIYIQQSKSSPAQGKTQEKQLDYYKV
jgi:hypothetical protein